MILKVTRHIFILICLSLILGSLDAQTTCNSGQGKVYYERLPNQQLQGFDDDVVRDTAPPFRVLEKCQDLCLRDRTVTNNLVRACTSIDFQPGSRIASFSGNAEYEESTCYLTREQATPEGIGNLMLVPNSVHFTEVCLTSNRPERECPSRRYVFERFPRKKLKLPVSDMKEITAANRTDCEDKCLNEFSFVCRSANYDVTLRSCTLSRFTRRTHPELLEDDPNSDYLENTCLNAERRCDGLVVFVKEENKKLGGPFEVDIFNNMTLEECQSMCLRAEKYFCRSVEFDDHSKQCILSEEDSISQKDDISISSSPTHHFYDLVCLDNQRGTEYPDNSVTSHLFSNGRRPDTAFQRYRNSRLGGEFHSEITGRSLSECLDECLRQTSFQCRSAVYSDRFRTCRLSRYNQRDGMRIIYDADYDYYENLMLGSESEQGSTRPDNWHTTVDSDKDRFPERIPGRFPPPGMMPDYPFPTKYPYDRFTPGIPPMHPEFGDRDRFPTTPPEYVPTIGAPDRYPNRRPPSRYPPDHFNEVDRYPDMYPQDYDRPRPFPDGGSRFPDGGSRFPDGGSRFPDGGSRYPDPGSNRYGPDAGSNRYGPDAGSNRYGPDAGSNRYGPDPQKPDTYPDDYYGDKPGLYPDTRNPPNRGHPVERPTISRYPPEQRYPMMPVNRPPMNYYYPNMMYNLKYPDPNYPENKYMSPWNYQKTIPPMAPGYNMWANRFPMNIFRYGNQGRYPYGGAAGGVGGVGGYGGMMPGPSPGMDFGDRAYGLEKYPPRPYVMVGFGGPPELDNTINSGHDIGYGVPRPLGTRCDDADSYKQMGVRQRMRKQFVRRALQVPSLIHCQRECSTARDFVCRSFNYKDSFEGDRAGSETLNCELSDRDTRELDVQSNVMFDSSNYDFYERSMNGRGMDGECLDVTQVCNEDGMEFTLRTNEPFFGRIYSYGFYDRCFFRGNGGTINVLRISGPQGFPECGTQKYGDTMTNIIVVQFSDNVQTGRDKRFNLTCLFRTRDESVVTSGYIGAGSGSPIPIEYLPAENSMSSKVQMYILYQGRPTTTIAVGDPLTFRLESVEQGHVNDIFATNVIARDPYSGKSVLLIDRYGCPVDSFVFPELGRSRDGDALEARFNAFKIPESNFLVFEATVKTCREGCQPAYCNGAHGRSFGRKKRAINETLLENSDDVTLNKTSGEETGYLLSSKKPNDPSAEEESEDAKDVSERIREMIEVFESREEMLQDSIARKMVAPKETFCLSTSEYYGLICSVIMLMLLLVVIAAVVGFFYRKYWSIIMKNRSFSSMTPESLYSTQSNYTNTIKSKFEPSKILKTSTPHTISSEKSIFAGSLQKTFATGNLAKLCQIPVINPISKPNCSEFDDPSEPIYSDVNLFERSRLN